MADYDEQIGAQIRESKQSQPEKAMWACCLYEAIDCMHRTVVGANSREEKIQAMRDAIRWFRFNDIDPGSYLWVCHILDLDPRKLRAMYRQKIYGG